MTMAPAPDVDRVLDRMGRSAFAYRSFAPPPDVAEPAAFAEAAPPPVVPFPLVGDALPEAAAPAGPAIAVAAQRPPRVPNAEVRVATAVPPTVATPSRPRKTSLTAMFHMISGAPERPTPPDDVAARAPAFPFRRG